MVPSLVALACALAYQATGEPWKLTGCLRSVSGHYIVTDEITNISAEVAGSGLARQNGNRVEVIGAIDPSKSPISEATRFIRVSHVKRLSRNCVPKEKTPPAPAAKP